MAIVDVVHILPQRVLDESRTFLQSQGSEFYEGTALWIGCPAGEQVQILRLLVPEQVAETSECGARVDLTPHAHYTLTDHLTGEERFYVRIHAHPGKAYHSLRDNENAILTHEGALSIVVPYFARDPIELDHCAIYRYGRSTGWLQLEAETIDRIFRVTK